MLGEMVESCAPSGCRACSVCWTCTCQMLGRIVLSSTLAFLFHIALVDINVFVFFESWIHKQARQLHQKSTHMLVWSSTQNNVTPNASRRTNFRDKNRELFSGELFSGEEFLEQHYCPRTVFPSMSAEWIHFPRIRTFVQKRFHDLFSKKKRSKCVPSFPKREHVRAVMYPPEWARISSRFISRVYLIT